MMQQLPITAHDETAQTLFKRAKYSKLVSGIPLFDTDVGGLRSGDIVEIYGPTSIGKSEWLYTVIVSCILPRKWNEVTIGGHEIGVIFFDNDYHFCMPRLTAIIEHRVRDSLTSCNHITDEDIQELITSALSRLQLFHCKDSLQFIVTLQSIPLMLENDPTIKALMIDSISSYYWLHKHEDKMGMEHQKHIANQCRLLALQGLIVLATKAILWKERKDNADHSYPTTGSAQDATGSTHNEYLYNWGRIVKYRVVLSTQPGDATPRYVAKLYTPPPSVSPVPLLSKPLTSQGLHSKHNIYTITDWGIAFL